MGHGLVVSQEACELFAEGVAIDVMKGSNP